MLRDALSAFDGSNCPVCDTEWDAEEFCSHVEKKLGLYAAATTLRKEREQDLVPIQVEVENTKAALLALARHGALFSPPIDCSTLTFHAQRLTEFARSIKDFLPLSGAISAVKSITQTPKNVLSTFAQIEAGIAALPEPNQQDAARDFLSVGQERLEAYRSAAAKLKTAEQKSTTARFIFDTYAEVTTKALERIYSEVEQSFSKLYRLINQDDEKDFAAKLKPALGRLGFEVDFYGRGFFPPGAYHSEGHQDGMGLCLYLALMNHLAGSSFTFAVLDDVLMSVDSGHRREVSKMLRERFPNTQFFLTTHDEVWLRSMKTVGLIEPRAFAHFRSWNVDLGPTEWDDREVWDELEDHLKRNDVRAASALLRNYLEYFSKEACHVLRPPVEFRGDAQFTLGDLLPSAVAKMKKLLKDGKAAAKIWKQTDKEQAITEREARFSDAAGASQVEQWQLNAAVHYNEWATLHVNDFKPLVAALRTLVNEFCCNKCHSILFTAPPYGTPEALRCICGDCNINLRKK